MQIYSNNLRSLCLLGGSLHRCWSCPLERQALPTLREMGDEPLAALRRVYERLYTPQHPIRKNLFFLDTIEAVRVIEGK